MSRLVDVYPYHKEQKRVKFLIFKRADEVMYPNQWRMIGGKAKESEKYYEAAIREFKEETGLSPSTFWSIPSLNQFYEPGTDCINHIPAFAAEINPNKSITLNHEHSQYKWISDEEIGSYIKWPEQRRLMKLLADIVTNNEIIEEWIINISQ